MSVGNNMSFHSRGNEAKQGIIFCQINSRIVLYQDWWRGVSPTPNQGGASLY